MLAQLQTKPPVEILLIDDNCGDTELLHEALSALPTPKRVHVIHDGDEALNFLYRKDRYANATLPDLILLDINMPRTNGLEVLAKIKNDLQLQHIPVIMLTSSSAARDVTDSYKQQANAYIVKPDTLEGIGRVARLIEDFWLNTVTLLAI